MKDVAVPQAICYLYGFQQYVRLAEAAMVACLCRIILV